MAETITCGYCHTLFSCEMTVHQLGREEGHTWYVWSVQCPNKSCMRYNIYLRKHHNNPELEQRNEDSLIQPRGTSRSPAHLDVPDLIREDFDEARIVLQDSAKASAALSRRCLQQVLVDQGAPSKAKLTDQIDSVIAAKHIPEPLAGQLHYVRKIGNFAAHPDKDETTGAIVEVEPGEADWNLNVLEGLFEFFYVGPGEVKRRQEAYDRKMRAAGKKPPSEGR